MKSLRHRFALTASRCSRAAGILFVCLLTNVGWAEADATRSLGARTNSPQSTWTAATNSTGVLELLRKASAPLTPEARRSLSEVIAAGAKLEEKDPDNRTALTHAVLHGDLETVRVLVQAGGYVKARDRFHKTPLLYAADTGRRDIVDYLASNGDLQSPTPLERKERQRR